MANKVRCIQLGNIAVGKSWDNPQSGRIYSADGITPTLNTCGGGDCTLHNNRDGGGNVVERIIVASRGRNPSNPSDRTIGAPTEQRLEPNSEGLCNTLTSVQKDNYVLEIRTVDDG